MKPSADYEAKVTGDAAKGYTIVNTHKVKMTAVTVTKDWADYGDKDGLRPDKIVVNLYANDELVDAVLVLNADNNWTGSFENLPKNKDGKAIVYTVEEQAVPEGYQAKISGDAVNGFTITNTHELTPAPEKPNHPDTGDMNTPFFYGFLLFASALLLVGMKQVKRMKK